MVVASVRLQLVFKPSSNVESLVGAKKRISRADTQLHATSCQQVPADDSSTATAFLRRRRRVSLTMYALMVRPGRYCRS